MRKYRTERLSMVYFVDFKSGFYHITLLFSRSLNKGTFDRIQFRSSIPHRNCFFFHARDKTKNSSLPLRVNAVVSFDLSFAFFTVPIAYPFYITLIQPPFLSVKATESYQYNYG